MTKKAVIIGGGIAGLAAALRLHQAGWQPLVAERAPGRRGGGYAVTFAGIGLEGARNMGILDGLRERRIPFTDLVYHKPNGKVGYTIPRSTVEALTSREDLTLMRGDIEEVLYEAVRDHAEIRFGTSVESVGQDTGGVRVTLSDGTTERADLLLGADGLHSATRRLVFGAEEEFRRDLDHVVAAFLLDHAPPGVAEGTTASLTSAGRTLAVISLDRGRALGFFAYRTRDASSELAAGPLTTLPREFGDMGWAAPDVLDQLRKADSVYFDSVSQIVIDSWSRGRVALLGDAAWCVTLFAGYGSSLAVGGADRLGSALESHPDDVPAALRAWEGGLREEAEKKQRLGRQVKGLYAPQDRFRLWLRDLPLRTAALPPVTRYLRRRLQLG